MKNVYFILSIVCLGITVIAGMMSYYGNELGDYLLVVFSLLTLSTSSGYKEAVDKGE
jgi:hypothetical protein